MNGWLTSVRISFSFLMCSTCFSLTTSDFFMIFSAKKQLAGWSMSLEPRCLRSASASTRRTRPNVPVPASGRGSSQAG